MVTNITQCYKQTPSHRISYITRLYKVFLGDRRKNVCYCTYLITQLACIEHCVCSCAGETSTVEGNRDERGSVARDDSLEQEDIEDEACMIGKVLTPAQNFVSVILSNLQINYEAWQAELTPDKEEEEGGRREMVEEGEEESVFSDADSKSKDEVTFVIPEVKIDAEDKTDVA